MYTNFNCISYNDAVTYTKMHQIPERG